MWEPPSIHTDRHKLGDPLVQCTPGEHSDPREEFPENFPSLLLPWGSSTRPLDVASPSCSRLGTAPSRPHPPLGPGPLASEQRNKQQKQPQVGPESEEQAKVSSCGLDGPRSDPRGADSNLQPTGHATTNSLVPHGPGWDCLPPRPSGRGPGQVPGCRCRGGKLPDPDWPEWRSRPEAA